MKDSILRDSALTPISEVKVDSKNRVCLPKSVRSSSTIYRIYANDAGQIVLDPQVLIPASELWLHENKEAMASVRQGLKEAGEGKVVEMPRLSRRAKGSKG